MRRQAIVSGEKGGPTYGTNGAAFCAALNSNGAVKIL